MRPENTIKPGLQSFDELKYALDNLPNQTDGDPCAVCQIGEPYIEFKVAMLARPGDEKIVERHVVSEIIRQLNEYLDGRGGRIYWRIRFESDVCEHAEILRLDVNGPDVDFITNERCVKDKNWRRIAAYCRLVRARMETMVLSAPAAVAA